MIESERIKNLNNKPINLNGDYILYWMQASQRVEYNHALIYAIEEANRMNLPLLIYFGVTDGFPNANERHYAFMLEGLIEVKEKVENMGGTFVIVHNEPQKGAVKLSEKAAVVICDRGYLRIQREWRDELAEKSECAVLQVESDVVVPIELTSDKEEYSAATIRRKIWKYADDFIQKIEIPEIKSRNRIEINIENKLKFESVLGILEKLNIDRSVKKSEFYKGGKKEADRRLKQFIENRIEFYGEFARDPSKEYLSDLSPYLHFGQISPVEILIKVRESGKKGEGADSFIEELLVRRELAINFVYYNRGYDKFDKISYEWAYKTLEEHKSDKREYLYTKEELENYQTHDIYWNAAQKEMVVKGKMHGYMRMYWAKKILEWTKSAEEAYYITIYLNDKYSIDGRDANGYAGVAWCYGKHDRAWKERNVFGKIRYMNAGGLERKFDIKKYVEKQK
jgi:deoxyribodipyrimidine photo-lyase